MRKRKEWCFRNRYWCPSGWLRERKPLYILSCKSTGEQQTWRPWLLQHHCETSNTHYLWLSICTHQWWDQPTHGICWGYESYFVWYEAYQIRKENTTIKIKVMGSHYEWRKSRKIQKCKLLGMLLDTEEDVKWRKVLAMNLVNSMKERFSSETLALRQKSGPLTGELCIFVQLWDLDNDENTWKHGRLVPGKVPENCGSQCQVGEYRHQWHCLCCYKTYSLVSGNNEERT